MDTPTVPPPTVPPPTVPPPTVPAMTTDADPDRNARLTTDEVAFIEWFTGEKWEGGAA